MKVLNKLMKSKLLLPVCGVLLVAGCSDSSPPPTDADTAAPAAVAPAQGKGPGAAQTAQRQPGAPIQPPGISEPKVEEPVTAVFNCGSGGDAFAMVTRTVPEDVPPTISLFLPPDRGAEVYQRLDAERAGEVYANEEIRLVLSGQTASIIIDDKTYTRCEYDHAASLWEEAKLSGVDFRGMGFPLRLWQRLRVPADQRSNHGSSHRADPVCRRGRALEARGDPERRRVRGQHERRDLRHQRAGEAGPAHLRRLWQGAALIRL
jgi:hypothetical protein